MGAGGTSAIASARAEVATAISLMATTTQKAVIQGYGPVSQMAIQTCRTISSTGLKKRR